MSKERFVVKDVVCDYGVFDTEFPEEGFICVCKARANALLVADILNTDYQKPNECVYWKDQQLAELKAENERLKDVEQHKSFVLYSALHDVLAKDNDENVASMIDQLTKQDNGELCEMYKDYQNLKADNERLAKLNNQYATQLEQEHNKKPNLQKLCNDLQQQLKEKDGEIEDLKAKLKSTELCFNITNTPTKEEMVKRITKQVCEKIRGFINKYDIIKDYQSCAGKSKFEEFLDQIEKGEDDGD